MWCCESTVACRGRVLIRAPALQLGRRQHAKGMTGPFAATDVLGETMRGGCVAASARACKHACTC
eukprot:2846896-Alexandrium_andersonii.AAC.1